jgi:hypothetical protein
VTSDKLSSWTDSTVDYDGSGPTFQKGDLIAIQNGSNFDLKRISSVSTVGSATRLNFFPAYSSSSGLAGASLVLASQYKLHNPMGGSSGFGTVSFVLEGASKYEILGCRGTPPKLTVSPKGRPLLEFSFQVNDWRVTTDSFSSLPGMASSLEGVVAQSCPFFWKVGAIAQETTPLSNPVPVTEVTFDFAATLTPIATTEGTNGRGGFILTEAKPSLNFKPYYDSDYALVFQNALLHDAMLQIGKKAAIYVGNAQVVAYPSEADLSGLVGHEVKLQSMVTPGSGLDAGFGLF